MIENTIKIRNRKSGEIYDCFAQAVDLNFNGRYVLRYNIGINGYNEWTCVCCEYSNDEFNEKYEVVKWSKAKKEYIPKSEYKFWIDDKTE